MSVVERVAREALACLGEAGRVLVPLACAGCDAPDVVLCGECSAELGLPVRLEQHAPALRSEVAVWGAGAYVGRRRRIVLAWKTQAREDLEAPLGRWTRGAGMHVAERLAALAPPERGGSTDSGASTDSGGSTDSGSSPDSRASTDSNSQVIWVVPAPSSWRRRWRGRPPVWHLADGLARGLADAGRASAVVEALHATGAGHGQRGKGSRERRRRGQRVTSRLDLTGRAIVLVDDVLTTGATVQGCIDAVEHAGGMVIGAVVLAGARVRGRA